METQASNAAEDPNEDRCKRRLPDAVWQEQKRWMATDTIRPDHRHHPGICVWISMTGPSDSDAPRPFLPLRGIWFCPVEFLYVFFSNGTTPVNPWCAPRKV